MAKFLKFPRLRFVLFYYEKKNDKTLDLFILLCYNIFIM